MKRFFALFLSVLLLCFSSVGFAREKTGFNYEELFDVLPWNVETGDWKDGRDITGENPEKERGKEDTLLKDSGIGDKADDANVVKPDVKSIDVVMILDKSGSMYDMRKDTVGGFNSFLDEQRKKDLPVKVSVGLFNQALEKKLDRVDLKEVDNLVEEDYVPQGMTAMLDAVGNMLSGIKVREDVNVEGNKVLVVIITDGVENASKEWTWSSVRGLIRELREERGYEFIFLGADIDSEIIAGNMGISAERSMKFKKTAGAEGGVQSNFRAVSVMTESLADGASLDRDLKWRNSIVEDRN